MLVIGSTFSEANNSSCPQNFNNDSSIEFRNALTSKKIYNDFSINEETKNKLIANPLPKRIGTIGGIINFDIVRSTTNNNLTTTTCCYSYSTKKRAIIAGRSKTTDKDKCPINRTCFCIQKTTNKSGNIIKTLKEEGTTKKSQNLKNASKSLKEKAAELKNKQKNS